MKSGNRSAPQLPPPRLQVNPARPGLCTSFGFTISKTRFFKSESASIFFSSVFSFSSSFNRLASGISIIPNLLFQR